VTWSELRRALEVSGLVDDAGATEPAGQGGTATIRGIAYDSRQVCPGDVFVALKGQHDDGARFAGQAIQLGAAAVVSHAPAPAGIDVPWVQVTDSRRALACLAVELYRRPSEEMQVVGITGTNGKTTTAFLVASMFEAAGQPCGLIGTVGYRVASEIRESARTTPEAPDLQRMLREMADRGTSACVMEVSSHALELRRVDGMRFAAGVFTNLTRDHLDFHHDMETYFQAKRRLFEMLPPRTPSIVNIDDPRGASLAATTERPVTYALNRPADFSPGPVTYSLRGLVFDVRTPRGTLHVESSLVGRPNVYNILAAVSTTTALDLSFQAIERGISSLDGVPGRFQVVSPPGADVTVVVDYAHTDDALKNLLETARPLTTGRMITVFGCGGDRDRTKRPLMGAVAGRLSDVIVITSDNPRSEDPLRIIDEIRRGLTADTRRASGQTVLTIADRHEAIVTAIDLARPGDVVLIAGKGHEKYQVIGSRTLAFDDVEVARDALGLNRSNSGVA
jgi:UDP-N-acetylmuramoyl-L-alanyl-D-glutamate--2,6-diaminopimelate ligase